MARKVRKVKLQDRGRELSFRIKEMGALNAEKWKIRAIMLLLSGNISMPEGASIEDGVKMFMAEGAGKLFKTLQSIDVEKALILFDELLYSCCEIEKNGITAALTPELIEANIEDSSTITKLRFECLKVHFDFLEDAGKFISPEGLNMQPQIKVEA